MAAAGAGGAETKYVENNFSTQLYKGTGAAQSIVSGVDLSTDGGLVISKIRDDTESWVWGSPTPPSLGTGRWIQSNGIGQRQNNAQSYTAFNDDGYSIGTFSSLNQNGGKGVSYSFRKTPGILDIVEFVGNGSSSRNIPHNLGSKPGWIVIMCTTKGENKTSWHRCLYDENWVFMDAANAAGNGNNAFPQHPTSTQFTIGSYNNLSSETYVAWIFGGGEEQGNASVQFNGIDGYLTIPQSSDYDLGTGEFTWECWVKHEGTVSSQNAALFDTRNNSTGDDGYYALISSAGYFRFVRSHNSASDTAFDSTTSLSANTWYHLAASRDSSNTVRIFVNGTLESTNSNSLNFGCSTGMNIGFRKHTGSSLTYFKSKFSNFRLTKGQCLYTSSFTPITTPLTTTSQSATASNVKLLCCNDTGASGYTKTGMSNKGGGFTLYGDPIGNTNSPFASGTSTDAGAIFGENEDKSLIKCGSYVGNGSSSGQPIDIGWEPQWVVIKNVSAGGNGWMTYDTMRGWFDNANASGHDRYMMINSANAETTFDSGHPTSTGFKITTNNPAFNDTGNVYCYIAIRRSDGYVGKPAKVGTDVFDIKAAQTGGSTPFYQGYNFVVDSIISKNPDGTGDFTTYQRLAGRKRLKINESTAMGNNNNALWDYMNGFNAYTGNDGYYLGWGWKRHAGFDVVCYEGTGSTQELNHSLGKSPEMIWVKCRSDGSTQWVVGHKGLNGGTNPWNYYLTLETTDAEIDNTVWADTSPSSSHFTVGGNFSSLNTNGSEYLTLLFASVDGISKVGSYVGQGTDLTVEFGFSPRFIMVKRADSTGDWNVFDTVRGLDATSNDKELRFNNDTAQTNHELGEPTATGFTFACGGSHNTCSAGGRWIYYAHA